MIMSYPLIDLLRVFILRVSKGKSPFSPDQNHDPEGDGNPYHSDSQYSFGGGAGANNNREPSESYICQVWQTSRIRKRGPVPVAVNVSSSCPGRHFVHEQVPCFLLFRKDLLVCSKELWHMV